MNDIDIADINDSGISLNDYEGMTSSRANSNSDAARDTPASARMLDSNIDNWYQMTTTLVFFIVQICDN